MLYDCFTFFNELELLELRLHTLNDVVDKFVILEADRTFTGNPKRFYYEENKDRFKEFSHKICHLKCSAEPTTLRHGDDLATLSHNAWQREFMQRNMLIAGLEQAKLSDVMMLSDIDEIPCPKMIEAVLEDYAEPNVFIQELFFYHINWLRYPNWWHGTALLSIRDMLNFQSIQHIREARKQFDPARGGWHFCSIGGAHRVATKMKAFAHVEVDIHGDLNQTAEKLEECFKTASDAYDPNVKMKIIPYNAANYPPYMSTMIERHPDWVKE